jgi:cell migration-inducing and hyaluronan-binding protein
LIITLHGDRLTPEVPLFGNEVIGIRGGNLEIHGKPALPTWADLESTAFDGALTITLHKQVNWQVDDEIVIASTSYDLNEAEVRTIKGIDIITNGIDKPILTLDAPLGHKHFAGIEDCLDGNVEMRGEVGLLTRNIVIKGDDNSKNDENGAVIAAYSVGDDTSIVKIEYVEMRKMGQAYKLGRYAIHLRVLGKMTASYIRGNSVRDSYNRFIALHTNGLTVEDNVAFEVKGHAIFIEDALEQDNKILNNLVINTRKSWSL